MAKKASKRREALLKIVDVTKEYGVDEAMVIGGEQIYAQALPLAECLYVTQVYAEIEGDAFFPELELSDWAELGREDFKAEGPNPFDYSFVIYQRAN